MARTFRGRAPQRRMSWIGAVDAGELVLTGTQALLQSLTPSDIDAVTVTRCRGSIHITAVPDAAGDADVIAFGIAVVSSQAATAGGAALPSPAGAPGYPFLWHQFVPIRSAAATAASDLEAFNFRIEIDSKAMRKMKSVQETVALIGELTTNEFASVNVISGLRVLLKE